MTRTGYARRLGVVLAAAILGAPQTFAAASARVAWINVDGPPAWVAGAPVDQKLRDDWRGVRLEPGSFVALRVAPRSDLRLVSSRGALRTDDLEISVSNGSGMFRAIAPGPPNAGGHLVLPRVAHERVVRLARAPVQTAPITIAAFVTRREPLNTLQQRAVHLNHSPAMLRWDRQLTATQYWPIGTSHHGELVVSGPTHVVLDTLVALPEDLEATPNGYRVYVRIDDQPADLLEFPIRQSGLRWFVDGGERVFGRRQTTLFAVPAGRHRVTLHADAEVYARASLDTPDEFLLASNTPAPIAPAAPVGPGSHWDLTEPDIEVWAHGTLAQRERAARRLARDNHRRGGGLLAANLLENTALTYPDHPRAVTLAAAYARRHAMHRQLLPEPRAAPIAQRFHWFASPQRYAYIAELAGRNPRYRQLALASVENAHFFELDPDEALVFAIPADRGESALRLTAVLTAGPVSRTFQIQFDDGEPPIRVDLPADPALRGRARADAPDYRLADDAVAKLTLSPPFASRNRPGRLVQAASVTLALPPTARRLTLSGASHRLEVTAQYRVSRRFALSEAEHTRALESAGPQATLAQLRRHLAGAAPGENATPPGYVVQVAAFTDAHNADRLVEVLTTRHYPVLRSVGDDARWVRVALGRYADRPAARAALERLNAETGLEIGRLSEAQIMPGSAAAPDPVDRDLASHRAPLARWLAARRASFRQNTPTGGPSRAHPPLPIADAHPLAAQARSLEDEGVWQPALERWRRLAGSAPGALRVAALEGQHRTLTNLGEQRLAEGYLRNVFLNDADRALRDRAFELLSEHYSAADNAFAQETLLATAVLRDPSVAMFRRLIEHLLDVGRTTDALTVALALPASDRPLDAIVEAAYDAGWWRTFDAAVAELADEPERQRWWGYRGQARGDVAPARAAWSRADSAGYAADTLFAEGLRIRDRLGAATPHATSTLAASWARWQDATPGAHRWRNAAHLVYASAGGAVLHWPDIDGYRQTFRGTPAQPLRLRMHGPQQLEIQARVVHASSDPVDDWLTVTDGAAVTQYSLDGSRPQPGVEIVGAARHTPSRVFRFTYGVGPGEHDIALAAGGAALLLQVYTRTPRLPLAALPELTTETLQAVRGAETQHALATDAPRATPTAGSVFADSLLTRVALYEPEGVAQDRPLRVAALKPEDTVVRRMINLVQRAERGSPDDFASAAAEAERLYADHASAQPILTGLKARLDRQADWDLLRSAQTSAGARLIPVRGWTPESPQLALRKALSDPVDDDEFVVTSMRELGVNISGALVDNVEIRLTLGAVAFMSVTPVTAYYILDDGARQRVDLHAEVRSHTVSFPIGAGVHSLKIGMENPDPAQYLRVRLRDDRDRPLIAEDSQRLYHVATDHEPVRFALKGPAWLRVHQRLADAETHDFRYLDAGWQTLTLSAAPGAEQTLYRVYRRVRRDRPMLVPPLRVAPAEPLPSFAATIPAAELPAYATANDELIRHRSGGWGVYAAAVDRRNVDEDRVGASERFGEFGATHRHRLLDRPAYFRTTLLARLRETGGATLVLRERIDYRPEDWPVNLRFDADLYAQRPGGELDGTEWSARVQLRADRTFSLNELTRHRPMVRVFARYLTLDEDDISDPGQVDQDVFSRYKGNHRYGLSVEDLFTYEPWVDTRWYGGPALATNEEFDPFDPDYVQARAGWTQLVGDWVVDGRYQFRRYFSDANRDSSATRHQFRLGLDWDPLQRHSRWHLDFSWIHDFASSTDSFRFAVRRDFGAPHATRDYYPGEVEFLGTRHRRARAALLQ